MILIDSSAWIEFLRGTGSRICERVDQLLGDEIATCDPIRMEILAGARDGQHLTALRGLLGRAVTLPVTAVEYDQAAMLYRTCRAEGETVRKLIDCLIAAVAISTDVPLLQADRDFDRIASHTPLRLDTP